jgi:dolichyl-phosphate-mannose--protein O-mannosyl transferase
MRNLHSHDIPATLTPEQREVTCFGEWGIGNTEDNWRVAELAGGGSVWHWGSAVKLSHEQSGWFLRSHSKYHSQDHQEVTCYHERDNAEWWELSL